MTLWLRRAQLSIAPIRPRGRIQTRCQSRRLNSRIMACSRGTLRCTSVPLARSRPCSAMSQGDPFAKSRWEELYALQAQKHWRAAHSSWWIARSYADRSGGGHCRVCKNRWRTPEGDVVARKFGDNNAARTLSRKRSKSEQGERCHPLPAETVGCV